MKRIGPKGIWAVGALIAAVFVGVVLWFWQPASQRQRTTEPTTASDTQSPLPVQPSVVEPKVATSLQEPDHSEGSSTLPEAFDAASLPPAVATSRKTEQDSVLDPTNDGWQTESFAAQASSQLKKLGHSMELGQADSQLLESMVTSDFSGASLRPAELTEAFRDASLVVSQAKDPSDQRLTGKSGFAKSTIDLTAVLEGCTNRHVKFKLVGVDRQSATEASTRVLFEATGVRQSMALQQTAVWNIRWKHSASNGLPLITSIIVDDYQEVSAQCDHATLFADCTEAVLGGVTAFEQQIRPGADYWMRRLEGHLSPRLLEGHMAISVGDVNADGLEDLYVCQPGGLPNRLFLHKPDGTVQDASAAAGVDILDWSLGSLLVDLDNDGDQDLAVLTGRRLLLLANDGAGHFQLRAKHEGKLEYSLTAADYDNDGQLDLYLCNYTGEERSVGLGRFGRPVPFHNATNGGANVLLRNDGDWSFRDVTQEVGLDHSNNRWSYAAAWEDYDNDGDQDLYVANDFGHNNLYRNDGGKFRDVAPEAGAIDANFGMSVTWADYDRDGWMDIYVSNMFSAAGNRVTFQQEFQEELSNEQRAVYQTLARGNTLLKNQGDGSFEDVSSAAGVTMGRWSWGSLFVDVNNDGWEDLLVTNGYLTQDPQQDL
ncbi:VCBS repeat-containing protein [Pirellulales bacterium]|nr:VCBS repeat-containing protein [Pirellulales bacterium]